MVFVTFSRSWATFVDRPRHVVHIRHLETAHKLFVGSTDFFIIYMRGGFKLAAFSGADFEAITLTTPNQHRRTWSCSQMTQSVLWWYFKASPLSQQGREVELFTAAVTTKRAIFYKSMMQELGFKDGSDSAPLFIDHTSALHVAGNRT